MNRRPRGSRRLAAVALLIVLVATGCAQSGEPTTFGEQLGPVSEDVAAALGVAPDTQRSLPERNFLEACITGDVEIEGVSEAERGAGCQCSYNAIVEFYLTSAESNAGEGDSAEDIEKAAYEIYRELDRELEDGTKPLPANIQTLVDDCFS